jgi:ribosomal protein S18 acetylase RimI-like enzyme
MLRVRGWYQSRGHTRPITDSSNLPIKLINILAHINNKLTTCKPRKHGPKNTVPLSPKQEMATFKVTKVRTPEDLAVIKDLFIAYTKWLNIDLTYQNFEAELASLPAKYSSPTGELLLARSNADNTPLGCVALRPLFPPNCAEMKRLYVTPAGRGTGVGKMLIQEILGIAKDLSYQEIKLDTLPHMVAAIGIYKSNGFVECVKYYETPIEGTVFLRKVL